MESIKNDNLSEIAGKYNINPNVICGWRKQFVEKGYQLFETKPDQENKALRNKISKLEQMLRKKEVELRLLKNFADFYESQNTS
jgi:transposase-like protein